MHSTLEAFIQALDRSSANVGILIWGLNLKGDITKVLPLDKNKSKFVIGKNNDKISIISLDNEK